MLAKAIDTGRLNWARGSVSKVGRAQGGQPEAGSYQEASVLSHVGVSTRMPGCLHNLAAGLPQSKRFKRAPDIQEARQKPPCLYVQHSLPPHATGHIQPQFRVGQEYVKV